MKTVTGTVVNGKVEVPSEVLAEGSRVAVVAPDEGEPVQLSPSEEAELTEAVRAIERGDYIDGTELLKELQSQAGT